MEQVLEHFCANEQAVLDYGAELSKRFADGGIIFLQGDLGAGKTTLVRGILRARGHIGAVKSPTYTLVEPYELLGKTIYHFDLYRLGHPEELEYMGGRDYFSTDALCLVEWPEKAEGFLPAGNLLVKLSYQQEGRMVREFQ
ncbi:MAG: TsaE protein, required for threonylcarbamoyladenosine t(6)A37 formation in tRNA [uncultured Thiotrichaceae bacterium]|uniref:tRNA threonylcarbamoyladenosine biosynthesis protein TsaE n=1 Tax=uncultured Thiotrichaceae bacterium TaxID=298394 RepID=A0A6S6T214_9GAMM|nr:MAG: TsaE protein, required for threonylcarbamoyladenosine t(6)A37 formation in tRNA [uncultured Thiotrichaceae bacterium]